MKQKPKNKSDQLENVGKYLKKHDLQMPREIKLALVAESYPKNDENYFYNTSETWISGRTFFRAVMCGTLDQYPLSRRSDGKAYYDENGALGEFLNKKYVLIYAYPGKFPDEIKCLIGKSATMLDNINTLYETIERLKPQKIVFISDTNEYIIARLKEIDKSKEHKLGLQERIIDNISVKTLPFPGREDGTHVFVVALKKIREDYKLG